MFSRFRFVDSFHLHVVLESPATSLVAVPRPLYPFSPPPLSVFDLLGRSLLRPSLKSFPFRHRLPEGALAPFTCFRLCVLFHLFSIVLSPCSFTSFLFLLFSFLGLLALISGLESRPSRLVSIIRFPVC